MLWIMKDAKLLLHRACAAGLWALAVLAPAIAWAQDNAPPQPTLRKSAPAWLGYLAMFVLLVVVIVVSLMPSKRSHQD